MKSATALSVTLTIVGSLAWYAARAQENAWPQPAGDAQAHVVQADMAPGAPYADQVTAIADGAELRVTTPPEVQPVKVMRMVDGKPVWETRTAVVEPGARSTWNYGQPPMPMPVVAPMPGNTVGNGTFNVFMPRPGAPIRKQIDEETAKQLNADRELAGNLAQAVERYKNADESQREDAVNELRNIVSKQFAIRQRLREHELAELESRLAKLRALHAKRAQEQGRIIEDRVQQIRRDADGLGWGDAAPGGDVFFYANGGPGGDVLVPTSADAAPVKGLSIQTPSGQTLEIRNDKQVKEIQIRSMVKAQVARDKAIIAAQKAHADAEWVLRQSEDAAHKRIDAKIAIDPAKFGKMEAAIGEADRAIEQAKAMAPGEARDEAVREAEQARREAEQEIANAKRDAWQEVAQARDEAHQEVEQARLKAMQELMEAKEDANRSAEEAAKEAAEDAARQDRESHDESWEERP